MGRQKSPETEVVGPLRIERSVMDKIRKVAEREERTCVQQINHILKEATMSIPGNEIEMLDGKIVVDELIYDPHMPSAVTIRIDKRYFIINATAAAGNGIIATSIKPRAPIIGGETYTRATHNHEFYFSGCIPRGGYTKYQPMRAATKAEIDELIQKYELTDEDISFPHEIARGELFGESGTTKYNAIQIRIKKHNPIIVERELIDKGIEAAAVTPERVDIRVD